MIPRTVLAINPLLLILLMGGSRFAHRLRKDRGLFGNIKLPREPVLVLGGDAVASLSRDLAKSKNCRLVGFLGDDADKHGSMLNGVALWAIWIACEMCRVAGRVPSDHSHAV